MADQDTLNINYQNGSTLDKLKLTYTQVTGFVFSNALGAQLKNTNFVGEVISGGTIKVRRMIASVSNAYGTARAAGKGDSLQNNGVDVKIDTDKEIVEEVENKDAQLYGIDNIVSSRSQDHQNSMLVTLDKAYFDELVSEATEVDVTGEATNEDALLKVVRTLETVSNDNVDGVDRSLIDVTLSPVAWDSLKKYINALPNTEGQAAGSNSAAGLFHGVKVYEAPRQSADIVAQARGSVAQPVVVTPYGTPSRIPESNAQEVSLFYSFGTEAVMPDLIFKVTDLGSEVSA